MILLKLSCLFTSFSPIEISLIFFQVRDHIMKKLRALLMPAFCFYFSLKKMCLWTDLFTLGNYSSTATRI